MTKTRAKTGGMEMLKDGIVSNFQRHIVSQRKLLNFINLSVRTKVAILSRGAYTSGYFVV